jgi:hypothetical protein
MPYRRCSSISRTAPSPVRSGLAGGNGARGGSRPRRRICDRLRRLGNGHQRNQRPDPEYESGGQEFDSPRGRQRFQITWPETAATVKSRYRGAIRGAAPSFRARWVDRAHLHQAWPKGRRTELRFGLPIEGCLCLVRRAPAPSPAEISRRDLATGASFEAAGSQLPCLGNNIECIGNHRLQPAHIATTFCEVLDHRFEIFDQIFRIRITLQLLKD